MFNPGWGAPRLVSPTVPQKTLPGRQATPDQATSSGSAEDRGGRGFTRPTGVEFARPANGEQGGGQGPAQGAYRLRSRQPLARGEAEESIWRRLFRIVDRPQLPPILIDCDSLGVTATEQLTDTFWNTPALCRERNLILIASAGSAYQEVADHCRIAQPEDAFPVGENWGVLILESPAEEFPPLLHLATELNGSIVTTRQSGVEQSEPVHCIGTTTDASLEADRDSALERLLRIRPGG